MPKEILVKSVLNKKAHRDSWFLDEYTLNPYSGCSFNCLYCYIRGSKYGEHMEEQVAIKSNITELLDRQLYNLARKQQYGFIVLSSATDPYLHFEKEQKLTRSCLELILKYRFPVHIITKSDLVIRDFDLLQQINNTAILPADLAKKMTDKALVTFSFSTIDDNIAAIFEPGATPPSLRLDALKTSIANGFRAGVSMMPMIPYITDTTESLEEMFTAFCEAGARYVMPATITLFGNGAADSKTLMMRAINKHYPHLSAKYEFFFAQSNELPSYYRTAFTKKVAELSRHFQMPDRIIE